jgi:hypothetical protein
MSMLAPESDSFVESSESVRSSELEVSKCDGVYDPIGTAAVHRGSESRLRFESEEQNLRWFAGPFRLLANHCTSEN